LKHQLILLIIIWRISIVKSIKIT